MSGDRIPEQQLTFKNFNLVQPAVRPGSAAPGLFRRWRRPKPRLLPDGIAGEIMKYVDACPFADPDAAARKLVEIGNVTEPVQDGRLYVELINAAFLNAGGSPDEYRRHRVRDHERLAMASRQRHLSEVHPGWR